MRSRATSAAQTPVAQGNGKLTGPRAYREKQTRWPACLELNPVFVFRSGLDAPVNGNRLSFSNVSAKPDFRSKRLTASNAALPTVDQENFRNWHL
jgi:hypothetical protein